MSAITGGLTAGLVHWIPGEANWTHAGFVANFVPTTTSQTIGNPGVVARGFVMKKSASDLPSLSTSPQIIVTPVF
jgi:hypothetical protein